MSKNTKERLHDGHRKRVKDRYLNEGLDAFEDHQVLELILFYCIPMKDTNEIAHKLLHEFGTLAHLFEAKPSDIVSRCGVSMNTAVMLSMIPSLARRYNLNKWGEKPILSSSTKAGEFVLAVMSGYTYEVFYVICLDSQNRVTFAAKVHEGTIDEAVVYPRLIIEVALRHKAARVILAHNHPGGRLQPSEPDVRVTAKIKDALNSISISLVDHIIAADDKYFSFAENSIL